MQRRAVSSDLNNDQIPGAKPAGESAAVAMHKPAMALVVRLAVAAGKPAKLLSRCTSRCRCAAKLGISLRCPMTEPLQLPIEQLRFNADGLIPAIAQD